MTRDGRRSQGRSGCESGPARQTLAELRLPNGAVHVDRLGQAIEASGRAVRLGGGVQTRVVVTAQFVFPFLPASISSRCLSRKAHEGDNKHSIASLIMHPAACQSSSRRAERPNPLLALCSSASSPQSICTERSSSAPRTPASQLSERTPQTSWPKAVRSRCSSARPSTPSPHAAPSLPIPRPASFPPALPPSPSTSPSSLAP